MIVQLEISATAFFQKFLKCLQNENYLLDTKSKDDDKPLNHLGLMSQMIVQKIMDFIVTIQGEQNRSQHLRTIFSVIILFEVVTLEQREKQLLIVWRGQSLHFAGGKQCVLAGGLIENVN